MDQTEDDKETKNINGFTLYIEYCKIVKINLQANRDVELKLTTFKEKDFDSYLFWEIFFASYDETWEKEKTEVSMKSTIN